MKTLFITTSGTSDVTRASIPIHLAVNGSLEAGHSVHLVLAGDATELAKASVREGTHGVGVPPSKSSSPRHASTKCPYTSERDVGSPVG